MPIHRLTEEPTRRAILLDLTCDSDGKIDKFIDIKDVKTSLELHELKDNEPYYVGMFLLGAYQEILGDFHNLFGDTDAVHVSVTENGYTIDHVVEGDSVKDVLGYVEYERPQLVRHIRNAIEKALTAKTISMEESKLLMRYYEEGLSGYTYLEGSSEERTEAPLDGLKKIGQKQMEAMKYSSSTPGSL
jgi:arginine decarboxylase